MSAMQSAPAGGFRKKEARAGRFFIIKQKESRKSGFRFHENRRNNQFRLKETAEKIFDKLDADFSVSAVEEHADDCAEHL